MIGLGREARNGVLTSPWQFHYTIITVFLSVWEGNNRFFFSSLLSVLCYNPPSRISLYSLLHTLWTCTLQEVLVGLSDGISCCTCATANPTLGVAACSVSFPALLHAASVLPAWAFPALCSAAATCFILTLDVVCFIYIYIFFLLFFPLRYKPSVFKRSTELSQSLFYLLPPYFSLFFFLHFFFFFTLLKSFFFLFSNTLCLSVARYILFKRHFIFFLKTIPSLSWPHNVGFKSSMCCRNLKLPRNVVACLSSHMFAVVHLVCSCSQELETFKKYLITNTFCVLSQRQLPGINVQTIWGRN